MPWSRIASMKAKLCWQAWSHRNGEIISVRTAAAMHQLLSQVIVGDTEKLGEKPYYYNINCILGADKQGPTPARLTSRPPDRSKLLLRSWRPVGPGAPSGLWRRRLHKVIPANMNSSHNWSFASFTETRTCTFIKYLPFIAKEMGFLGL